ncbi:MAG: protein phosphatase 2C domain-containing protein [Pseudomonadota bacterium]
MRVGVISDQGGSKKENEDSFLVDTNLGLFMVADGLGAHQSGKCASTIATEEISLYLTKNLVTQENAASLLSQSILNANSVIARAAEADPEWRADMGTTVVVALIVGNRLVLSNVGDSRAYRIKNGTIEQISEDHTFVADWVKSGEITKEEARRHNARHGLWMALGIEDDVEPYVAQGYWNGDSTLVLCSDGLTDVVEDNEILRVVKQSADPQMACENLLVRAKELRTSDHVTIVVVCGS